jgi:hypothetical protein
VVQGVFKVTSFDPEHWVLAFGIGVLPLSGYGGLEGYQRSHGIKGLIIIKILRKDRVEQLTFHAVVNLTKLHAIERRRYQYFTHGLALGRSVIVQL